MDAVAAIIEEAARSIVMPRFRSLATSDIRQKSRPDDLVTIADIECQAFLAARLEGLLPGATLVGEEGNDEEETSRVTIAGSDWCWIVDPIDGTYNFAHGKPGFSIMVALTRRGQTVAAWIHEPLLAKTASASLGQGAYCAGMRLRAAEPGSIKSMTGALYVGQRRTPALHARMKEVRGRLGPQSFQRGAGAEYLRLVFGEMHYAVFTRLLPWDHAAGVLLHAEAGGHAALFDGAPYAPGEDPAQPLLLAPNRETWSELGALLSPA